MFNIGNFTTNITFKKFNEFSTPCFAYTHRHVFLHFLRLVMSIDMFLVTKQQILFCKQIYLVVKKSPYRSNDITFVALPFLHN